jgi:hypothetical protein
MKSRYLLQLGRWHYSHPDFALYSKSDFTTVYGSLSQSLYWHSPSSVMNLIFHLHSCLGSCYLSSHFIGLQLIVLNGCEQSLSLVLPALKPTSDGPKAISWTFSSFSFSNVRPFCHSVGNRLPHVFNRCREYDCEWRGGYGAFRQRGKPCG